MEKHFKSIEGINTNEVLTPHPPQSKFYLKITGIPYLLWEYSLGYLQNADVSSSFHFISLVDYVSRTCRVEVE